MKKRKKCEGGLALNNAERKWFFFQVTFTKSVNERESIRSEKFLRSGIESWGLMSRGTFTHTRRRGGDVRCGRGGWLSGQSCVRRGGGLILRVPKMTEHGRLRGDRGKFDLKRNRRGFADHQRGRRRKVTSTFSIKVRRRFGKSICRVCQKRRTKPR